MRIKSFVFNPFQENTYILYDESRECIIIDPGCHNEIEEKELAKFITEKKLKPVGLINTHCHIDHILGNHFVANRWNIDLQIHELEIPFLNAVKSYYIEYGISNYKESPEPKLYLKEGDKITFGESILNILFTPGHSPGHICLYSKTNSLIISGDIIFQMGIGRTDLPGGNYDILIKSITEKLFLLPEETQIYCGHGPSTVLAFEKENNPFLQ